MSKIARVKFIRDKEPNIKALTAENKVLDGALYVATDTGTLWMGISSSSLIQIKDNINTNTTYNLTKSGNTITLRGSDGSTFNVTDSNTVYGNATASAAGLMSAADKAKLDGVAAGSNHVTVDAELSTTSTNPVQNKVIKSALDGKSNTGHTHDDRYYTETEINTKLNGKSNTGHKHVKADITDFPTSMPASDVSAWAKAATKPSYSKAEVGLGNVDNTADSTKKVKYATSAGSADSVAWSNVSGRPSSMPASDVYSWAKQPHKPSYTASEVGAAAASHTHTRAQISDFPTSMPASDVSAWAKAATKPSYSKAEVGLGNVDNTADSTKKVKYATSAGSADSVAWSNVSGRPSSMPASDVYSWAKQPHKPSYTASEVGAAAASHTHTRAQISDFPSKLEPYFANNTWYVVGNDAAIGNHNKGGAFCIKGLNGTPNVSLYNSDDSYYGQCITSADIGSQSVKYATTAGSANTEYSVQVSSTQPTDLRCKLWIKI